MSILNYDHYFSIKLPFNFNNGFNNEDIDHVKKILFEQNYRIVGNPFSIFSFDYFPSDANLYIPVEKMENF